MSEAESSILNMWVQRVPIRIILEVHDLTQKQFEQMRIDNNFPERERAASPANRSCDPSISEIEDACKELRKNWTEKQKISRLNGKKSLENEW